MQYIQELMTRDDPSGSQVDIVISSPLPILEVGPASSGPVNCSSSPPGKWPRRLRDVGDQARNVALTKLVDNLTQSD